MKKLKRNTDNKKWAVFNIIGFVNYFWSGVFGNVDFEFNITWAKVNQN